MANRGTGTGWRHPGITNPVDQSESTERSNASSEMTQTGRGDHCSASGTRASTAESTSDAQQVSTGWDDEVVFREDFPVFSCSTSDINRGLLGDTLLNVYKSDYEYDDSDSEEEMGAVGGVPKEYPKPEVWTDVIWPDSGEDKKNQKFPGVSGSLSASVEGPKDHITLIYPKRQMKLHPVKKTLFSVVRDENTLNVVTPCANLANFMELVKKPTYQYKETGASVVCMDKCTPNSMELRALKAEIERNGGHLLLPGMVNCIGKQIAYITGSLHSKHAKQLLSICHKKFPGRKAKILPETYCNVCFEDDHDVSTCSKCDLCLEEEHLADCCKYGNSRYGSVRKAPDPKAVKATVENGQAVTGRARKIRAKQISIEAKQRAKLDVKADEVPQTMNLSKQQYVYWPHYYPPSGNKNDVRLAVDIECVVIKQETGAKEKNIQVCSEIAIVGHYGKKMPDQCIFKCHVNWLKYLKKFQEDANGPSSSDMRSGLPIEEVKEKALKLMAGQVVFFHNADVDFGYLGITWEEIYQRKIRVIDLQYQFHYNGRSVRLRDNVMVFLGKATQQYKYVSKRIEEYTKHIPAHGAAEDAFNTLRVGIQVEDFYEREYLPTPEYIVSYVEQNLPWKDCKPRKLGWRRWVFATGPKIINNVQQKDLLQKKANRGRLEFKVYELENGQNGYAFAGDKSEINAITEYIRKNLTEVTMEVASSWLPAEEDPEW